MLLGTLLVILLLLALVLGPMGLTMAKQRHARNRGAGHRGPSPGHPIRERRTLGRRPVDIGR